MIETKRLTKHYGDLAALVDLDLAIETGDIFGFIGPNGAGKTTTMRILATLLEPSRGQAFIDGRDVTKKGKEEKKDAKCGILKQNMICTVIVESLINMLKY